MTNLGVPVPRVPLFQPKRLEQRNMRATGGTEQRNTIGTTNLKVLAEQALSRIRSGTSAGTKAEREAQKPFRPPGKAAS